MLLDSARHVLSSLAVLALEALGHVLRVTGRTAVALATMLVHAYDVYIGIPLRIERMARGGAPLAAGPAPRARREVAPS
jgi:hypothetical protein